MKKYKPTTPSRRNMTGYDFSNLTEKKPLKSLTKGGKRSVGRNNQGKITTRHKGAGVKRKFRVVDFIQDKVGVPGKIASLEYDPNRTARIALVIYSDGEKRYILAPKDIKIGDEIVTDKKTSLAIGNRMYLKNIPQGTIVHNVELFPEQGGKIAKSAGSSLTVLAKEGKFVQLQMPSSEIRQVLNTCMASIGQVSNIEHSSITIGKAGRSRKMGIRPSVRGSVMNPVDHPHGGGEGKQGIGLKYPKTPWGKPALGVKTRRKKQASQKFIVRRRKKKNK
jgi:large subunit ribosomal protein L2